MNPTDCLKRAYFYLFMYIDIDFEKLNFGQINKEIGMKGVLLHQYLLILLIPLELHAKIYIMIYYIKNYFFD